MAALVRAVEADAAVRRDATPAPSASGPTFRALARAWLAHLVAVDDVEPSTLRNYRCKLVEPGTPHLRGSGRARGRIMAALGDTAPADITAGDVSALLDAVAADGASRRTVNRHREIVVAILNFGLRPERRADWGLTENAASAAPKRRVEHPARLEVFTVEQIEALARAAETGRMAHRRPYDTSLLAEQTGATSRTSQFTNILRVTALYGRGGCGRAVPVLGHGPVGVSVGDQVEGAAFPRLALAVVLGQLDREPAVDEPAERAAGFELGQLAVIADEHQLAAGRSTCSSSCASWRVGTMPASSTTSTHRRGQRVPRARSPSSAATLVLRMPAPCLELARGASRDRHPEHRVARRPATPRGRRRARTSCPVPALPTTTLDAVAVQAQPLDHPPLLGRERRPRRDRARAPPLARRRRRRVPRDAATLSMSRCSSASSSGVE